MCALYALALVEANRGDVGSARRHAQEGVALGQQIGSNSFAGLNLQVLGFVEFSVDNFAGAHGYLGMLADIVVASGLREPGPLKFVPDDIEALIALGDLDKARSTLEPFEQQANRLDRVWARATSARCRGLLLAAEGDLDGALEALEAG